MRKIIAFILISVDGYFAGPNGEIDWFKTENDDEFIAFTHEESRSSAALIFGHTTYELMAGYWPTPDAIRKDPIMAGIMNGTPKIVFSKTLKPVNDGAVWKNVKVIHEINREEILSWKEQGEGTIAILGSGSIVQQFANSGLIDEYQFMVVPVILGAGKYLFRDFARMNLKLKESRVFGNGKVFLIYSHA
jgi:dihydrofolate reductase